VASDNGSFGGLEIVHMPRKRPVFNTNQFIRDYVNHRKTLTNTAAKYGISHWLAKQVLLEHGIAVRGLSESHTIPINADQLVDDYVAGIGLKALASKFSSSLDRIRSILLQRGVVLRTMSDSVKAGYSRMSKRAAQAQDAGRRKTRQKTLAKIEANAVRRIVARYRNGDPLLALAKTYGVCRRTIARLLTRHRVKLRSASEQERLKWASMTDEQRRRQVDAAHEAARGRKVPLRERRMRAQTRFEKQTLIGPHERAFAKLLDAAGIKYRQQLPCGVYNLDFALTKYRVAVEIQMGSGNALARANRGKRNKYILDQWHLFEVRKTGTCRGSPISPTVVEELIAFAKLTRLDQPSPGQHRVIRPDGCALGTCPKVYRRPSKNGRYHLVHRTVGSDGRPL
jgi:very-short-patch-repair endonuclease